MKKILLIGNYPPPLCGWAIQTKLVAAELQRRGHTCKVLKINENRKVKDPAYVDVQGGFDYLFKVAAYAMRGYRLNVHLNGQSRKGYLLALAALLGAYLGFRPALATFHGGLSQTYFPRPDSPRLRRAFRLLFALAGGVACDNEQVRQAIVGYGINPGKVAAIETFSSQYLDFQTVNLRPEIETFLQSHSPVFFCYLSFRPEYKLDMLRSAMAAFHQVRPRAGFVWLGFPDREMPEAGKFLDGWPASEREALLLLPNLPHDEFLSLMSRCDACIRTPACDGVAASVLESLCLGIPVVASENGARPLGAVTYKADDPSDLTAKLRFVTEHSASLRAGLGERSAADNVGRMADWLTSRFDSRNRAEVAHAT